MAVGRQKIQNKRVLRPLAIKDIQVGSKIFLELEKNSCGTRQSRNLEKYILNRAQKNLRRKMQVFGIGGTVALRSPIPTF